MSEQKKPEVKPDTSKMEYRYLGNSGLRVSVLGFGNAVNYRNDKITVESLKTALALGNKADALKYFTDIKDNYDGSPEAASIDVLVGLAQ